MFIFLSIVMIILCLCMITLILLQQKNARGLGAVTNQQTQSAYWEKTKGRSREAKLERLTKICGVIFFVLALVMSIVQYS